ncbi:hypothetical protein D0Y65_043854 [Glycine soja]|uniref:Uncharacterized protein n=1 Tax=Glycine soja TaxID=3848 RepID=A0A445GJ98_GLYSO|nr:hypothetical protein D0Y65_043854 [Glycine soja]
MYSIQEFILLIEAKKLHVSRSTFNFFTCSLHFMVSHFFLMFHMSFVNSFRPRFDEYISNLIGLIHINKHL